jgi:multidrug transporter EmrE-like cation transporter
MPPLRLIAGAQHMLVLIGAIVAIEMLPFRLNEQRAWLLVIAGAAALVAIGLLAASHRRAPVAVAAAVIAGVRLIGLPLLGLAFFSFWTIVYAGLWAFNSAEAFSGIGDRPRLADFFYYAVSTAFTAPPEGIAAGSRGVRSATMIELLTALALIGLYFGSLFDWHRSGPENAG